MVGQQRLNEGYSRWNTGDVIRIYIVGHVNYVGARRCTHFKVMTDSSFEIRLFGRTTNEGYQSGVTTTSSYRPTLNN